MSQSTRTRSLCPRVCLSLWPRAVTSESIVTAASCAVASALSSSRRISVALVERRATLNRLGALSGKTMVMRSSRASGASRMVSREVTRLVTTATTTTATASHRLGR
jgi:hypothetical protein